MAETESPDHSDAKSNEPNGSEEDSNHNVNDVETNDTDKTDVTNSASEESQGDGKGSGIVPLMSLPLAGTAKESTPESGIVPLMSIEIPGPADLINNEIESTVYGYGQTAMPDWCESAYGYCHDYSYVPNYTDYYQYQPPELPPPCYSTNHDNNPVKENTSENQVNVKSEFVDSKCESPNENDSDSSGVVPLMSIPIPLMSLNSNVSPLAPNAPVGVTPLLPPREVESLLSRQTWRTHTKKPYDRESE